MSVVVCPSCEDSFGTVPDLSDHTWSEHIDAPNDVSSASCPTCDYPITQENILFHLSCISEIEPNTIWTIISDKSSLCLVCGSRHSEPTLTDHIRQHATADLKEALGGELSCVVCTEAPDNENRYSGHIDCLVRHLSIEGNDGDDGGFSCPYCERQAMHEGALEWHIWLDHFDCQGFDGECPGCNETINFGSIKEHLLCRDDVHGPAAASLFDLRIDDCFLCDISAYNPQVLKRHISGQHLHQIEDFRGSCNVCGDPINDNQVSLHYPCLAAAADADIDFREQPTWRCPVCNEITETHSHFINHLEDEHGLDLFVAGDCRVCGDPLSELSEHHACLERVANHSDSTTAARNIDVPAVLDEEPEEVSYEAEHPLTEDEINSYYQTLTDFVQRERQSARDEGWRQYETIPLPQLASQKNAIPELIALGTNHHPDFELQFLFERPVPDEVQNPDDLIVQFGIYPRQRVIIGADTDIRELPLEAEVTFIDDQTIGISPDSEQSYRESELRSALNDSDTSYHIVDLLSPTPFDRKQHAISAVEGNASANGLVTGGTTLVESPREVGTVYSGELNDQQTSAVGRALGEPTLCCIHGPPGTGKTRTLTAVIELAVARGDRVLACAHSNQAIDNLLTGGGTVDEPAESSLDSFVRDEGSVSMVRVGQHSTDPVVDSFYRDVQPNEADIVGATTSASAELDPNEFDLVIIDEATQADQPATFIPLLRGDNLVLAGDHKQLPPFCSDETAREEDMHISLFEHFQEVYGRQVSTPLRRQYRMNEEIAAFPNSEFYEGQLEHGEENRNWQVGDLNPMVGHHIQSEEQIREKSMSRYNPGEADLVAQQVRLLQMYDVNSSDIGVITPYSAQIGAIANAIYSEDIDDPDSIDINTIDSYQGAEREAVIVSFVRSNDDNSIGFLSFPDEGRRRLNVALTRAKKRLVIIGDFATLGELTDFRAEEESCAATYRRLEEHLRDQERIQEHA